MTRRRGSSRRGAVAVIAALCLIPMIGIAALVIDLALFRAEQWRAQAAADAASYAAVRVYDKTQKDGNGDPMSAASAAALSYASVCWPDGQAPAVVTALQSQKPQRYGTADLAVRVEVTPSLTRLFSGIWGSDALEPRAAAVSVRVTDSPPSIILLNPRDQDSLFIAGGARIVAEGEVQVKSNAARAANINNMGSIKAPTFKIAGNYQLSSSGWIDSGTATTPGSDASAMVDPLESMPQPDPAGMTSRTSPSGWNATNPYPIYPGVYNDVNGLKLNSGGMNYTMAPGLYYIKNGNFEVSNGVRVTGTGVTIYLYNGNVNIQGGDGISLIAPTSGTYQDVAIIQRSVKNATTGDYTPHTIAIANGTNNTIQGKVYAPGAAMTVAGGSNNTYGTQLIVNKLNISNNAKITLPKTTGSASARFYLAE